MPPPTDRLFPLPPSPPTPQPLPQRPTQLPPTQYGTLGGKCCCCSVLCSLAPSTALTCPARWGRERGTQFRPISRGAVQPLRLRGAALRPWRCSRWGGLPLPISCFRLRHSPLATAMDFPSMPKRRRWRIRKRGYFQLLRWTPPFLLSSFHLQTRTTQVTLSMTITGPSLPPKAPTTRKNGEVKRSPPRLLCQQLLHQLPPPTTTR